MPATPAPKPTDWEALAAPFPADVVSRLPKQMKRDDQDKGKCAAGSRYTADDYACGGWHARSLHLSYVGHADVTMRLNEVDPTWTWEPMALTEQGTPLFTDGGLWIRLTVLGVTRLGFGDAVGKNGPAAVKELIGDAIRNAAMRFGVATYLWSKSERSQSMADPTPEPTPTGPPPGRVEPPAAQPRPASGTGADHTDAGKAFMDTYATWNQYQRDTAKQHAQAQGYPQPVFFTEDQAKDVLEYVQWIGPAPKGDGHPPA